MDIDNLINTLLADNTSGDISAADVRTVAFALKSLVYINADANITASHNQAILADTSAGSFTVLLPENPSSGHRVVVADPTNSWETNNLIVGRNGQTINDIANNLVLAADDLYITFVFTGSTWRTFGSPTLTGTGATGTWPISVSGNAATVTNGVVTTGSYADPAWITSLDYSKLSGTVPIWNQSTTGNAATASTLATARTISLTGDVSGSVSFNGSANVSITATVADDSHNHIIANVDGLQTALDGKAPLTGTGTSGTWPISVSGNAATVSNGVYTSRTISAGNGLTGGGSLASDRTITLGTPSTVTGSSTNTVTSSSHTHEINITKADVGLGNVANVESYSKDEADKQFPDQLTNTLAGVGDITGMAGGTGSSDKYPHLTGFTIGATGETTSFTAAVNRGLAVGARLPTIDELEAELVAGTGGGYDNDICWSSSQSRPGYVWANYGKPSNFNGKASRVELSINSGVAATRYVVNNNRTFVPYSDNADKLDGFHASHFATAAALDDKVDKVSGKKLSTEDYTTAEKNKLSGIAAGAQVNVPANLGSSRTATTVTVTSSTGNNVALPAATTALAGVMTSADKTKLDGVAAGATANTGTVTSVGGTGGYGGLTLSGTVTSSGNLTLGGTPTGTWPIAVTGNAATATELATARTINGTSFNGTANITTANWGTARTLTVGATGKSVNGSGNVSWSLAEIGAQDKLVAGTNIKTLNGQSLLGAGDMPISVLPIGTLQYFAGSGAGYPGDEWLLCDNSIYLQAAYPELFDRIGFSALGVGGGFSSAVVQRSFTTAMLSYEVVYGNGLFVAVGNTGNTNNIRTSPDGITWTDRTSASTSSLQAATYFAGLFIAGGSGGALQTSPDGITWTLRTSVGSAILTAATHNGSIAVMGNLSGQIYTSTDGINWTLRTSGTSSQIRSLVYADGRFVYGTNTAEVGISTDGINWTVHATGLGNPVDALGAGDGLILVGGTGGVLRSSTDGINWTARTSGTGQALNCIKKVPQGWLFGAGSAVIRRSTDGITWTAVTGAGTQAVNAFDFMPSGIGGATVVYVGAAGTVGTYNILPYNYDVATEFPVPNALAVNISSATEALYIKAL